MPHIAGMRVRYNPEDEQFVEIKIGDEPLMAEKTYVIAATDFEFSQLINYLVIQDDEIEYEIPTIMPEVLEDYIRQKSPLQAPEIQRVSFKK